MHWGRLLALVTPALLLAACAGNPDRRTLAELRNVQADTREIQVEDSLDRALQSYRRFLEETPVGEMTPEAMRRLADLQIEREYGIIGDGQWLELPAPDTSASVADAALARQARRESAAPSEPFESDDDFEARATAEYEFGTAGGSFDGAFPGSPGGLENAGALEAIEIYTRLLAEYPNYERADQVLYQMSRAYDELGRTDEAIEVMERLIAAYPYSGYFDEVQFRRGEYFFTRQRYLDAEEAYMAVTALGLRSPFHELALYKLGWSLYKQDMYEESLHQFIALLDYRLSVGYDFEEIDEDDDEDRRVADTFRVVSLSFSNMGGPEVLEEYFTAFGARSYEDRIYRNLGEFYLDKLRYNDAALVYKSFIELNPFHRVAPQFSMRVVEIYDLGGFPMLVVESKKEFATDYGLQSEYWHHYDVNERPEVLSFLKTNLTDLANHYHALYQEEALEEDKPSNYVEAQHWYREFLVSFPRDEETPSVNYQLADLLLEHGDFGDAAREYERTAYEYDAHGQASAAGYAAVYAHRENLKIAAPARQAEVKRATVDSSLRFADTFVDHEHAPVVLGAAVEDLYEMRDLGAAVASGRTLIQRYPRADTALLRTAWTVVAHASFDLAEFVDAERAYAIVIELTPADDEGRQAMVDNLAASIYKQGEEANAAEDYRAAADHFLRIRDAAPTSEVRAAAEYDAAAALMRLEDWGMAAAVLQDFRRAFPDHELQQEATQQLAFVYREDGQLSRAAEEYERVAEESDNPQLRGEALLLAGELYEDSDRRDSALSVYVRYVEAFPRPLDVNVETRFKIAEMYEARYEQERYHQELERIVAIDAAAGSDRTGRMRYLAARSALVLAERLYGQFTVVQLVQPFDRSLALKQQRMGATMGALEALIDYEVAEVTAAATFYMAEVYYDFSNALLDSERPTDLGAAELADYELVIEEEAFPFEELAIEVHEKNLELMLAGVFNPWIVRSLDRLASLMPGRYAKQEISTGFIGSIESYAYRSPGAEAALGEGEEVRAEEPTASLGSGSADGRVDVALTGQTTVMGGVDDALAR
jgi:cellulose synthase operon protein C